VNSGAKRRAAATGSGRKPDAIPVEPDEPSLPPRTSNGGAALTGVFTVPVRPEDLGKRLDRLLAEQLAAYPGLSRTRMQALVVAGRVRVNGHVALQPSAKLAATGEIAIDIPEPAPAEPEAQALPLAIVYEDAHLLVLDKPAGLVVHPAAGHDDGTLVNALIAHCGDSLSGIGGVRRPGIVHRLDKDTTGLMVVAKTDAAHRGLADIFADHGRSGSLERAYLAFVWGTPSTPRGTIERSLGRHPHDRKKIAVVPDRQGRHAVTHWTLERAFGTTASLLRCRLETGRTHQIRVHLTEIGHPLIGDPVYGTGFRTKAARLPEGARQAVAALGRQALHAATLGFDHPVTGAALRFDAPLPDDLVRLASALADAA
jgi:23S rRNA pseudouridine1911/1915/1917 synthase